MSDLPTKNQFIQAYLSVRKDATVDDAAEVYDLITNKERAPDFVRGLVEVCGRITDRCGDAG